MRLAWCTPLSKRSGISKYSLVVLSALGKMADVTVFAPVAGDDYDCDFPVERIDDRIDRLAGFDAVFYNTGNNPEFHTDIHRLYERVPGITIVHDKRLHGFFFTLWAVGGDPARYAAMMRYYYGSEGERAASAILSGQAGLDSHEGYPLVEPALWNATGIVVHSQETARLVARYGDDIPIITQALPFNPDVLDTAVSRPKRARKRPSSTLLVSSGGVHEQKRISSVIQAIASEQRLRDSLEFVVVGGGDQSYVQRLHAMVAELGLQSNVTFTGWVDDEEMYGWLSEADIAVNLRYPSMESSSLSLVEQMYFSNPVIVTDTSYYSELPQDVAIKVPVDGEVEALTAVLRHLVDDPAHRRAMGAAARTRALTDHSPDRYATALFDLATRLCEEGDRR